ncbi:40S ribosomal protein S29-like [Echinops telfairi]|uniref:40S ribosomal protein S29-like n=1 Tax=Echinops telfairi TaxID=9371 RepID=A0AC55DKL0_ECHTE|nr:40S ribosomal protein S29-like [Echinops telfairi]
MRGEAFCFHFDKPGINLLLNKNPLLPRREPGKELGHQQFYWGHPRKFGQGSSSRRVCSNRHGLIRKYGLNVCRQCFRQYMKDIGLIKLD